MKTQSSSGVDKSNNLLGGKIKESACGYRWTLTNIPSHPNSAGESERISPRFDHCSYHSACRSFALG
jgi:hypothetical protein